MNKIRVAMIFTTIFCGIFLSDSVVKADSFSDGPNVGKYVYEDEQYITNSQYDRLAEINKRLDTGIYPQKLYLIISKNDEDLDGMSVPQGFVSTNDMRKAVYLRDGYSDFGDGYPGEEFYDNQGYSDHEITQLNRHNTLLLYDIKHNVLCLMPSTQSQNYITDYVFWKSKFGLNSRLKHGSDQNKIDAALDLANRLEPKLQRVAESDTKLRANDFSNIEMKLDYVCGWVIAIQIVVLLIYLKIRKKGDFGNPSEDIPDESYDAGFDEGYYYGNSINDHSN